MKKIAFIALALLVSTTVAASSNPWSTPERYKQIEIPIDWIPADRAAAIDEPSDFPRVMLSSVAITDFIRVYGVPSELIVPKSGRGTSFLFTTYMVAIVYMCG